MLGIKVDLNMKGGFCEGWQNWFYWGIDGVEILLNFEVFYKTWSDEFFSKICS